MIETKLAPHPRQIKLTGQKMPRPKSACVRLETDDEIAARDAARLVDDLLDIAGIDARIGAGAGAEIVLRIDPADQQPEGYRLEIAAGKIELVGTDATGLFYAGQTLLQCLTLGSPEAVELCEINDWPEYKVRELMVDPGRAPFSMPLLKRVVRIMARLKLNSLHLHLNDDQLNGLRYDNLPIGAENPWAISIDQLRQLVVYARKYHVQVVPEIEAWGHAGSVVYHYPELSGGPGMWGGASFGMGDELYELLEKMLNEVVPVLEEECFVHLGLDEARWATLPSVPEARKDDYTPERHVGRLYDLLAKVADRHGRRAKMRVWADHGGRPVPEEIAAEVIVEPWMYMECRRERIVEKLQQWGGAGKPPMMLGAGMSGRHPQGAYGATRIWCQEAVGIPNVEGVDICLWESNDVAGRLVGVFGGADYAWTPQTPSVEQADNEFRERLNCEMMFRMKNFQSVFTDADPAAIRADAGFEAFRGFYITGPLAGRPVAPTVTGKQPLPEAEFGE